MNAVFLFRWAPAYYILTLPLLLGAQPCDSSMRAERQSFHPRQRRRQGETLGGAETQVSASSRDSAPQAAVQGGPPPGPFPTPVWAGSRVPRPAAMTRLVIEPEWG